MSLLTCSISGLSLKNVALILNQTLKEHNSIWTYLDESGASKTVMATIHV